MVANHFCLGLFLRRNQLAYWSYLSPIAMCSNSETLALNLCTYVRTLLSYTLLYESCQISYMSGIYNYYFKIDFMLQILICFSCAHLFWPSSSSSFIIIVFWFFFLSPWCISATTPYWLEHNSVFVFVCNWHGPNMSNSKYPT